MRQPLQEVMDCTWYSWSFAASVRKLGSWEEERIRLFLSISIIRCGQWLLSERKTSKESGASTMAHMPSRRREASIADHKSDSKRVVQMMGASRGSRSLWPAFREGQAASLHRDFLAKAGNLFHVRTVQVILRMLLPIAAVANTARDPRALRRLKLSCIRYCSVVGE